MRCVWLFLLVLFCSSPLTARQGSVLLQTDMQFERISVEHGLSNFTVSSITQDKYGFLWIGTEDGLNRYDGYTFLQFRSDEYDSTSLPGSLISTVYADRRGTLWVAPLNGGVCRFDPTRNAFIRCKLSMGTDGHPAWINTTQMFEDRESRVWLCTNAGLWRYDAERDSFVQFDHHSSEGKLLARITIRSVSIDRSEMWWIGSSAEGLFSYDPQTHEVRRYTSRQDKQYGPIDKEIIALCADKQGYVWLATLRGAYRLNTRTGTLENFAKRFRTPVHLVEGIILDVQEDSKGNIWIGTFHGGLYRYIPAVDTFLNFRHDPDDPRSLVSNRVESVFEDMTGTLWFASYRAGLNKYTPVTDPFYRFMTATPGRPGIRGDAVYAIAQDSSGRLLFGTNEQGLTLFDPATGNSMPHPARGAPLYGTLAVCVDRQGNIWTGEGATLLKLDRRANRFKKVPLLARTLLPTNAEVKCITQDHMGDMWVGLNEGGLFRIQPSSGAMTHYTYSAEDSTSLPWNAVWSIFEDSRNTLWVGTFGGGIARLNRASNTFIRYRSNEGDPLSLSGDLVYSITEDAEGFLWVGTFARGLNRFDPSTGKCKRFFEKDGLPNNFVKVALPDDKGNLWISTDRGIAKLDGRTGTFTNLAVTDGLHGDVFLSGAYCRTREGLFLFGGMGGATGFIPDSVRKLTTPPPVAITAFQVYDRPFPLERGLYDLPTVTLSHDQNFVSFEFAALDFTAPARNRYKFKMEGLDTGWVDGGVRRFARYTHLPPGRYTFRVIGANKDGVWNHAGASFLIIITPPFWSTWWFRGAMLALLIALGVLLYNYRVNRLLEIERLRVRIASDLHDDIGSSLTKISLQSELIQEGIEPQEMTTYLKNIARMSRELVTAMSDIVWSIDARNDTIESLLDKMRNFAASTLAAKDVQFTFAHSGLDLGKKLPVDVRENLYLIFKEAINNIARHAAASKVSIVLRNDSDKFSLFVVDDGKGWSGDERPSGHGVKNMRMRAQRLKGTIEFVREEGTRVVLTMRRI